MKKLIAKTVTTKPSDDQEDMIITVFDGEARKMICRLTVKKVGPSYKTCFENEPLNESQPSSEAKP